MNRFLQFQVEALELAYQESDHPTREKKMEVANRTGLDAEQVTSWFNRRRARKRDGEARRTSEQRILELQQELQECRRREAELRAEIQHLRHQLARFTVDSQIDDPIVSFVNGHA